MRISHRDSLLIVLSVRPVRAQCSTKGSAESASVDQRTDRKKCAYLAEWHGGGRLRELVCWIDELCLLRAVETYVKDSAQTASDHYDLGGHHDRPSW